MSTVAVATDSTNYLPRSLSDSEGVHQVSLYVGWKGQSERELDMDGFEGFYARLRDELGFAQQLKRMLERRAFQWLAIADDRFKFRIRRYAEHHRQRGNPRAQIRSDGLPDLLLGTEDIEQVVDHLKGHPDRVAETLHQRGGFARDHREIVLEAGGGVVAEPPFHHLALGQLYAGLRRRAHEVFLEASAQLKGAAEQIVAGDQRRG